MQLHADDLIVPTMSISAPADSRAVVGSEPVLTYTLHNTQEGESTVDLSVSSGSGSFKSLTSGTTSTPAPATPWTGVKFDGGQSGSLQVGANLSGVNAGQSTTLSVSATNAGWNAPATASSQIQVVENRLLTGSVTIDAGRHLRGQTLGVLTLHGGEWADNEATRITVNANSFAQYSNGLRLTNSEAFTFNGANQSHDVAVTYNGPSGSYAITQTLPGTDVTGYTDASGAARADFGGQWDVRANYGNITGDKQNITLADSASSGGMGPYASASVGYVDSNYRTPSVRNADTGYFSERALVTTPQLTPAALLLERNGAVKWELERGDGVYMNERQHALVSAESIPGSTLDLTGVSVAITGTALEKRTVYTGSVNLGRYMVGSESEVVDRADTVQLSTSGSDDQYTRVTLAGFNESAEGITAQSAGGVFNSATSAVDVNITGNFVRTHAEAGSQSYVVGLGQHLTGEGLAGEGSYTTSVGYVWTTVENNTLTSRDFIIIEKAGAIDRRYENYSVERVIRDSSGTYIDYDADVSVKGTYAAGSHDLGTTTLNAANGRVTGEGLVGETVIANTSFNTRLAAVADAEYAFEPSSTGPLGQGDTVTLTDTGSTVYQAGTRVTSLGISGGDRLQYEIGLSNGLNLGHGESTTVTVEYVGNTIAPEAGELGRIYRAALDVEVQGVIDANAIRAAINSDAYVHDGVTFDSKAYSFALETRFDAPAAASAASTMEAGTDFGQTGLVLQNADDNKSERFAVATEVQVRDGTLESETEVSVSFQKLDDIDPAVVEMVAAAENTFSRAGLGASGPLTFASDIVNVSGLDGVQHVLQISFDQTIEGGAPQVIWLTSYNETPAWVNAVLGNSNISALDLEAGTVEVGGETVAIADYLAQNLFIGTYEAYLASLEEAQEAQLGAWGYSKADGTAWAVIDHNSSFAVAAVPEPSTYAAIFGGLALVGAIAARRRAAREPKA